VKKLSEDIMNFFKIILLTLMFKLLLSCCVYQDKKDIEIDIYYSDWLIDTPANINCKDFDMWATKDKDTISIYQLNTIEFLTRELNAMTYVENNSLISQFDTRAKITIYRDTIMEKIYLNDSFALKNDFLFIVSEPIIKYIDSTFNLLRYNKKMIK
jgi:hypothetical protein